ncbi:MAG: substrate-binding domain-containing protein, partial [Mogibacterium sp.]|nr:substrate-binding domain-containing protein [Mogibacterium sp.]
SPYYIGSVHENEPENGEKLVQIILDNGAINIGLIGWEQGDATWLGRWEGYKAGVEKWNKEHPDDQATLSEPQYAGTSSEGGSKAAEALMSANPDLDALIPAGGGGDPLQGAIAAVERAGKTDSIDIVSTDFLPDLGERLEIGSMAGESGGHYCDPLFAFMAVYNAVKGNYTGIEGKFEDIPFPYLYVSSPEDYADYEKYFVDQLPYTDEELVEMADLDMAGLKEKAASLSIEDAAERSGK